MVGSIQIKLFLCATLHFFNECKPTFRCLVVNGDHFCIASVVVLLPCPKTAIYTTNQTKKNSHDYHLGTYQAGTLFPFFSSITTYNLAYLTGCLHSVRDIYTLFEANMLSSFRELVISGWVFTYLINLLWPLHQSSKFCIPLLTTGETLSRYAVLKTLVQCLLFTIKSISSAPALA